MSASKPLIGVKAYVEVCSKNANYSSGVIDELRKLGASVSSTLSSDITHLIYKAGSKATLKKASRFGAHVVSVEWVDRCKIGNEKVQEYLYKIETDNGSYKKKQKSMQPKDFEQELKQASDKLDKVKKRRSDIQIPSPLTMVADRIKLSDFISAPRTPPAMQRRIDQLREQRTGSAVTSTPHAPAADDSVKADLGNSPVLRPSQNSKLSKLHPPLHTSIRIDTSDMEICNSTRFSNSKRDGSLVLDWNDSLESCAEEKSVINADDSSDYMNKSVLKDTLTDKKICPEMVPAGAGCSAPSSAHDSHRKKSNDWLQKRSTRTPPSDQRRTVADSKQPPIKKALVTANVTELLKLHSASLKSSQTLPDAGGTKLFFSTSEINVKPKAAISKSNMIFEGNKIRLEAIKTQDRSSTGIVTSDEELVNSKQSTPVLLNKKRKLRLSAQLKLEPKTTVCSKSDSLSDESIISVKLDELADPFVEDSSCHKTISQHISVLKSCELSDGKAQTTTSKLNKFLSSKEPHETVESVLSVQSVHSCIRQVDKTTNEDSRSSGVYSGNDSLHKRKTTSLKITAVKKRNQTDGENKENSKTVSNGNQPASKRRKTSVSNPLIDLNQPSFCQKSSHEEPENCIFDISQNQEKAPINGLNTDQHVIKRITDSHADNMVRREACFKRDKSRKNIVLTSFHSGDRGMIKSIIKKLGGFKIQHVVDAYTSHVVCGDNRRTMNVLFGISYGCWVVSADWVLASLENGDWLSCEENYLMSSHFKGASLQRRTHLLSNKNKLFSSIGAIYISHRSKPSQEELVGLLQLNGGKVAKTRRSCKILLGNESDANNRCMVVKESWILDCVSSQRLLDYRRYNYNLRNPSSENEDSDTFENIFDI